MRLNRHDKGLTAIDLFAGAGGATEGLKQAGFTVVAAVEIEEAAASTFRENHPKTLLYRQDIRSVNPNRLRAQLRMKVGELSLLEACPPCQGFSSLKMGSIDDSRNNLMFSIRKFARAFRPKCILMENVPGLASDWRLRRLCGMLQRMGYSLKTYLTDARDFGVPQRRKRLIMLAFYDKCNFPESLASELLPGFRRDLKALPKIFEYTRSRVAAKNPLHVHPRVSPEVLKRIKAIPINGNRLDLPRRLALKCHSNLDNGAKAAYGRISTQSQFAPTMTTRCTSPSCGSFVHPRANRPITLLEAALIQTFPKKYRFRGGYTQIERQIGNAVPVRMAKALAMIARNLLSPSGLR
jgi:DNA (cytosine-5)-methyltransferase 1